MYAPASQRAALRAMHRTLQPVGHATIRHLRVSVSTVGRGRWSGPGFCVRFAVCVAQDILSFHTRRLETDRQTCGAEWWVQVHADPQPIAGLCHCCDGSMAACPSVCHRRPVGAPPQRSTGSTVVHALRAQSHLCSASAVHEIWTGAADSKPERRVSLR